MTILFYITAFLFSLGQLGRISFFDQQVNFYLYEVTLTLSLLILFVKYRFLPVKEAWKKFRPVFLSVTRLPIISTILIFDLISSVSLIGMRRIP